MKITSKLDRAIQLLQESKEDLEKNPKLDVSGALLEMLYAVDDYYKEWCEEDDDRNDLAKGTTYETGDMNIEFYIEAEWWYEISKHLRRMKNNVSIFHD